MERKFTIFALFYFVFEGKFQVQAPRGAYIRRGDLTEGFLRYDFGGLIFGGAYRWRGLFSEFYGTVEALVSGHRPGHANKVSITAAGRLQECENTPEFVWELRKTARFVKVAISRAFHLQECPLGQLPLCKLYRSNRIH